MANQQTLIRCDECKVGCLKSFVAFHIKQKHPSQIGTPPPCQYICNECNKSNTTRQNFELHLNTCPARRDLISSRPKCDICWKEVSDREMVPHIMHNHPSSMGLLKDDLMFHCEKCGSRFRHKFTIERHVLRCGELENDEKRSLGKRAVVTCDFCSQRFVKVWLWSHISRAHPESASYGEKRERIGCELCLKQFGDRDMLLDHMKSHCQRTLFTKKKDSNCPSCPRVFATKVAMRRHKYNTKCGKLQPLVCDQCGISNYSKGNFELHVQKFHIPFAQDKLSCDGCGVALSSKHRLMAHLRRCFKRQ